MTVNTLGSHEQVRSSRTVAEWLWPFLPMAISAFCLSSLVYYHWHIDTSNVRTPLQALVATLYRGVGFAPALMFFWFALIWSSIWLYTGKLERPLGRLGRLVAMLIMLGVFLNLGDGAVAPGVAKGELGAWLAQRLVDSFGYVVSLLLVWAVTFASLLLATDFFFREQFERLRRPRLATELGVETAVTDHLRGLSDAAAEPKIPVAPAVPVSLDTERAASSMRASGLREAAAMGRGGDDDELPLPDALSRAASTEAEDAESEATPRRSYFERRRRRHDLFDGDGTVADAAVPAQHAEAHAGEGIGDDDWIPSAPENQEIDDPETLPVDALDAGEIDSAEIDTAEIDTGEINTAEINIAAAEAQRLDTDADEDTDEESDDESDEESDDETDDETDEIERASSGVAAIASDEPESANEDAPEPSAAFESEPVEVEPIEADSAAEPQIDATEPIVSIPRPEHPPARRAPEPFVAPRAPVADPVDGPPVELRPASRQRQLFQGQQEGLIQEAIDVVTGARRASATLLQRKLRVDYQQAILLLAELAARGVIALEGDATQGRVLG